MTKTERLEKLQKLAKEKGSLCCGWLGIPDEVLGNAILDGYFEDENTTTNKTNTKTTKSAAAAYVLAGYQSTVKTVLTIDNTTHVFFNDGDSRIATRRQEDVLSYDIGVAICIAKKYQLRVELDILRGCDDDSECAEVENEEKPIGPDFLDDLDKMLTEIMRLMI